MTTIITQIGEIIIDLTKVNNADKEYHSLMIDILVNGKWKENRTGTQTLSIFGPQLRFKNILEHFPLITTKRVHWKSVVGELLWFLSGSTNKFVLKEKYGVTIWDEWGDNETGDLGPVYGFQWRNFDGSGIDQLSNVINDLKKDPDDRRLIVTAWNPKQIKDMALPPCHWSYQFYSVLNNEGKRELSMIMNIRSWDIFLGGPFNIAEYALLLQMVAQTVDMIPHELIINAGDAHLYENHIPFVIEQLQRDTLSDPTVSLNLEQKNIFEFSLSDINLLDYNAHPNWRNVPVAV